MDDKILKLLRERLDARRQQIADALLGGAAKDFAEAQSLVGQARGLAAAQIEIDDLLRMIKEQNDD